MKCWLELIGVRSGRVRFEDHTVFATDEVVVTSSELRFRSNRKEQQPAVNASRSKVTFPLLRV